MKNVTDQTLYQTLLQILRKWHDEDILPDFQQALPYLRRELRHLAELMVLPEDTEQRERDLVRQLMDGLKSKDVRGYQILNLRFFQGASRDDIADQMQLAESSVDRLQRQALQKLVDVAHEQETDRKDIFLAQVGKRLPAVNYHQLVGIDHHLNAIRACLEPGRPEKIICINGIGGIGKTTLAYQTVQNVIDEGLFDDIVWITASQEAISPNNPESKVIPTNLSSLDLVVQIEQQLSDIPLPPRPYEEVLSAVIHRLRRRTHLIVVDNLENFDNITHLTPLLLRLAQDAHILITCRHGHVYQDNVFNILLTEADEAAVSDLIQSEAKRLNLKSLIDLPRDQFDHIYNAVGGNMLALRLLIGQAQEQPLETILKNLKEAQDWDVESLYYHIYRRSWNMLDDDTRMVLVMMPLISETGVTFDRIQAVTKLDQGQVTDAINTLIRLALLLVKADLENHYYSIHNLTETFLHEQVTKWLDYS